MLYGEINISWAKTVLPLKRSPPMPDDFEQWKHTLSSCIILLFCALCKVQDDGLIQLGKWVAYIKKQYRYCR